MVPLFSQFWCRRSSNNSDARNWLQQWYKIRPTHDLQLSLNSQVSLISGII